MGEILTDQNIDWGGEKNQYFSGLVSALQFKNAARHRGETELVLAFFLGIDFRRTGEERTREKELVLAFFLGIGFLRTQHFV